MTTTTTTENPYSGFFNIDLFHALNMACEGAVNMIKYMNLSREAQERCAAQIPLIISVFNQRNLEWKTPFISSVIELLNLQWDKPY